MSPSPASPAKWTCGIIDKMKVNLHKQTKLNKLKSPPNVGRVARAAGRRSTQRRADTGDDGDGRDQAACNKRRALTGFRPAPPVIGNCRPPFPRRAIRVLRPSSPPTAGPTTDSSSLGCPPDIPDDWHAHHAGILHNSSNHAISAWLRDLRLRHLSPITPSTHDGSKHDPSASPQHQERSTARRFAGYAFSLIVSEGRSKMYAYPTQISTW